MISTKDIRISIFSRIWKLNIPYSVKYGLMMFFKYIRRKRPAGTQKIRYAFCKIELLRYRLFAGSKDLMTIYDFNDSPPAIGDFISWLMLIRYFQKKGVAVEIVVLDKTDHPKLELIHKRLFKIICGEHETINYKIQNINSFREEIDLNKKFLLFQRKLFLTKKANTHYFNLVNLLCKRENNNFYNKFLLSDLGLNEEVKRFGLKEYVVLHLRYTPPDSYLYTLESIRNASREFFIELICALKEKYPNQKILIVSDKLGSEFYKNLSIENNLDCYFSKDHLDDFVFDCQLVLNANAYFQVNGGGMCAMAFFSKVPYLICAQITHTEYRVTRSKKNHWSSANQIFREICLDDEFYYHLNSYININ